MPNLSDAEYLAEVRESGKHKSEDYQRMDDAELLAWKDRYIGGGKFRNKYGDTVDKPWERGPNTPANMNGEGVQGDYGQGWNNNSVGGGGGGGGGGGRGWGGPGIGGPAPVFTPPTYESVMQDPGFQFELKQGQQALQGSQAAQGLLRTGGSVADLLKYSQGLASTRYGEAYNRGLQQWQTQYQPWAQQGNWNLSQWTTQQNAALQKYLQKEGEIFGLLGGSPYPTMPSYGA